MTKLRTLHMGQGAGISIAKTHGEGHPVNGRLTNLAAHCTGASVRLGLYGPGTKRVGLSIPQQPWSLPPFAGGPKANRLEGSIKASHLPLGHPAMPH